MSILWCMVPEIWSTIEFLSFWTVSYPFTPLRNQKIKILNKWKKYLMILSLYKCVPKMTVIWWMVPEIWSMTDRIFCHFGPFLYFYPPNNPKNQNFEKMKTIPGYIIILHRCTKNDNHIRYGSWDMECDGQSCL